TIPASGIEAVTAGPARAPIGDLPRAARDLSGTGAVVTLGRVPRSGLCHQPYASDTATRAVDKSNLPTKLWCLLRPLNMAPRSAGHASSAIDVHIITLRT